MRHIWSSLLMVCSVVPVWGAPGVDEILANARKALGDIAGLQSLSLSGVRRVSVATPDGPGSDSRESELHFLLPDKFMRAETLELPGGMPGPTIIDVLDGELSWHDTQNAPSGGNIVVMRRVPGEGTGAQNDAAVQQARTRALRSQYLRYLLLFTLTPPPGFDVNFEYTGEAESMDGKAWIIDAAGPNGFALRLFIDQKTNLPVMATWHGFHSPQVVRRVLNGPPPDAGKRREISPAERPKPVEVEFELRLSDYAKHGSIWLPKLMTLTAEGKLTEELEVKSAKVNPNLKPEKFRK